MSQSEKTETTVKITAIPEDPRILALQAKMAACQEEYDKLHGENEKLISRLKIMTTERDQARNQLQAAQMELNAARQRLLAKR